MTYLYKRLDKDMSTGKYWSRSFQQLHPIANGTHITPHNEFIFGATDKLASYNAIIWIKSDTVSMDEILLKCLSSFSCIILP